MHRYAVLHFSLGSTGPSSRRDVKERGLRGGGGVGEWGVGAKVG